MDNDKYKKLKIISKSLNRNPNNHFLRTKFYQLRKVYESLCSKLTRKYDQQVIKKLETLQTTDPNNFWNLLKQLKTGGKFVSNKEDLGNLNLILINSINLLILKKSNKELKDSKLKRPPGIDCISSEMIKCSNNVLVSKITKLFNLILDSGCYPETWNLEIIHSIHKNGSNKDPSNYRGITLISSLGKLFSSLIWL